MKILFLDIDGVLNHRYTRYENDNTVFPIDMSLVLRLKKIIEATDAKIVLSSTWRLSVHSRMAVEQAIGTHGMSLHSWTRDLYDFDRSIEILDWMHRNPGVTKFAILDDWAEAGTNGLSEHLFRTDDEYGLTEEIVDKVIQWLK
jgi:hypothetical protein